MDMKGGRTFCERSDIILLLEVDIWRDLAFEDSHWTECLSILDYFHVEMSLDA